MALMWDPNRDYRRDYPPPRAPVRRWKVLWTDDKGRLHTKTFELRYRAEHFAKFYSSIIVDRWAL